MSERASESVAARRAAFVAAARAMIGCPWSHQARSPGVAVDCGGLVVCASAAVGIVMRDEAGYPRRSWPERMIAAMKSNFVCIAVEPARAPIGSVLLFGVKRRDRPQHLGVWTGASTFIHSWADYGRVIESPLESYWTERLHSVWDFPETTWQAHQ